MSDLFGNHIVGFPTRRLILFHFHSPAPPNAMENVDFYVVQTPADIPNLHGSGSGTPVTAQSSVASTPTVNLAPGQIAMTGRQTAVVGTVTHVQDLS